MAEDRVGSYQTPSRKLPLIADRRREAIARALFEGIDVQAAYELAGFKRPRGNAQRMEREPFIQARINRDASSMELICLCARYAAVSCVNSLRKLLPQTASGCLKK